MAHVRRSYKINAVTPRGYLSQRELNEVSQISNNDYESLQDGETNVNTIYENLSVNPTMSSSGARQMVSNRRARVNKPKQTNRSGADNTQRNDVSQIRTEPNWVDQNPRKSIVLAVVGLFLLSLLTSVATSVVIHQMTQTDVDASQAAADKNPVSEVDMVGLQAEVKTLKSSLSQLTDVLNDLTEANHLLETEVGIVQRRHNTSDVAFMAELSATIQYPTEGSVVVFDHVYTNKGDAYNSTHGVFTAPTNGTYYFNAGASTPPTASGGYLHLFVMKGEVQVGYIFLNDNTSHWLRRNTDPTIYLVQGDEVYVKITHVRRTRRLAGCCLHTQFSGFLVHAD